MTYKKIGQIAHVSPSTVCKALSGSKEISAELTQEIIRIAEELGYFEQKRKRKNEYAKSDMINIALICPEIISVFYSGIITSLKKEIEQRDGLTSVYVYDFDDQKLDKIVEQITVRNAADGIVMLSANCPKRHQSIPIVCIHAEELAHDSVFCDTNAYMSDMVAYLKELGHTDIAFVGEPKTEGKLKAFQAVMQAMQLPCPPENIYIINERFEQIGYRAVEQMKTRSTLPTAVICAYDEVALAMIHSFTGNGIRIPEQVRYDYVEESQRVNALAINQTFYGLAGFLTTLALSPVLALIQENGNKIFGMTIYAQQLFSAFSMVITLILLVYVLRVVNKIKKVEATEENFEQE